MVLAGDLVPGNTARGCSDQRTSSAVGQDSTEDSAADPADNRPSGLGHVMATARFGSASTDSRADQGQGGESCSRTKHDYILC